MKTGTILKFSAITLCVPILTFGITTNAFAEVNPDYNRYFPAETSITLNDAYRFDSLEDVDNYFMYKAGKNIYDNSIAHPISCNDNYTFCEFSYNVEGENGQTEKQIRRTIEIAYINGDSRVNDKIDSLSKKIKNKQYSLTDMPLMSYLKYGFEVMPEYGFAFDNYSAYPSEDAQSRMFYFTEEYKKDTDGSNIDISIINRGSGGGGLEYTVDGNILFFHNGIFYGSTSLSDYMELKFYVPSDTKDSDRELISAAQKRLDEHFGKNEFAVSEGGEFDGMKYLTFKNKNNTFPVQVIRDSSKIQKNTTIYTRDLLNDLSIEVEDTKLPTDAKIESKDITKTEKGNSIWNKIGKKGDHITYDIKLKSRSKSQYITKISDNMFKVRIPIPKNFKNNTSDFSVYYVDSGGNKTEHEVIVEDGYAIFYTNHFSEYTLVASQSDGSQTITIPESPATFDNIVNYLLLFSASTITLVAALGILYKKN